MRKILFLTFIILPLSGFSQYPKIIDMQGMTDADGVTHLVYRVSSNFRFEHSNIIDSDIYTFNCSTQSTDTLHQAYTDPAGVRGQIIGSIDFWDNDPHKYIRYYNPYFDYTPGLIERFSANGFTPAPGLTHYSGYPIIISPKNPSTVYLSKTDSLYVSTDSGSTWNAFSQGLILIAANPFDEKYLYAVNQENHLLFSSDTGHTFVIADENPIWNINSQMKFDKDRMHVYVITESDGARYFITSAELGQYSTWLIQRTAFKTDYCISFWYNFEDICVPQNNHLQMAVDDSTSGRLFLSEGNLLYISLDYGNTFSPDTSFPSQLTGLYLIPASEILYLTTAYQIQKHYDKTIDIIKDIHPSNLDRFYPLNDGDTRIYFVESDDHSTEPTPIRYEYYTKEEIMGDTLMDDGIIYKKIKQTRSNHLQTNYWYQRFDNNTIIQYPGFIFYDFSGIPGDELYSDWYLNTRFMQDEDTVLWDYKTVERTYFVNSLGGGYVRFARDFGLTYSYDEYDFGNTKHTLTGAIINGVVYGDTSFVVSIEDEPGHPYKFKLKPNYPNPFNAETVINYELRIKNFVTLKVYDVSGKEIKTLVNKPQQAGRHSVVFDGYSLASGVYFFRIEAGSFSQTRKMLLIK